MATTTRPSPVSTTVAPALVLDNVSSKRGGVDVVRDVSLTVGSETVALLGLNGSGKTTLLRTISGLTRPHKGTIRFLGKEISTRDAHAIARRGVGYVPQTNQIFPELSVRENLRLGAYLLPRRECNEAIEEALALFPRLGARLRLRAAALSGGEHQMLALAKVIVRRPKMLLIDELSAGLATSAIAASYDVVRAIADRGVPVLLAEQNLRAALAIADRAAIMSLGRIQRIIDIHAGQDQVDHIREMLVDVI